MDINSAILASLASDDMTRSEIAATTKISPSKVAGALVTLVAKGQVVVSGKARIGGKDVSVYAVPARPVAIQKSPLAPLDPLTGDAIAKLLKSNLYLLWGGYVPLDVPPSKKLASKVHTED